MHTRFFAPQSMDNTKHAWLQGEKFDIFKGLEGYVHDLLMVLSRCSHTKTGPASKLQLRFQSRSIPRIQSIFVTSCSCTALSWTAKGLPLVQVLDQAHPEGFVGRRIAAGTPTSALSNSSCMVRIAGPPSCQPEHQPTKAFVYNCRILKRATDSGILALLYESTALTLSSKHKFATSPDEGMH